MNFHSPQDLSDAVESHISLEAELTVALKQKQFINYFQPRVDACVQMPSLPAVEKIEAASGIPTRPASVATAWGILCALNLQAVAPGGDRFLANPTHVS